MAFFWVELIGNHIIKFNGGNDLACSECGGRTHHRWIGAGHVEAMIEIEMGSGFNVLKQWIVAAEGKSQYTATSNPLAGPRGPSVCRINAMPSACNTHKQKLSIRSCGRSLSQNAACDNNNNGDM